MYGASSNPSAGQNRNTQPSFWLAPHPFAGSPGSAFSLPQPVQATVTPLGMQPVQKKPGSSLGYSSDGGYLPGASSDQEQGGMTGPPQTSGKDLNFGGLGDWAIDHIGPSALSWAGTMLGGPIVGTGVGAIGGTLLDQLRANEVSDVYTKAGLDPYNRSLLDSFFHSLPFGNIFVDAVPTLREAQANINTINLKPEDFGPVTPPGWTPPQEGGTPSTDNQDLLAQYQNDVLDNPNNVVWYRHGGLIPEQRDGASGAIPAMVHQGEFVMRPESVKKYGIGLLSALNSGKIEARKARGLLRM